MAENHSPRQESCSEMQKSRANAKGKQDPFFMDKLNVISMIFLIGSSHFEFSFWLAGPRKVGRVFIQRLWP